MSFAKMMIQQWRMNLMSSYFDLKGWAHRLGQLSFSKYSSLLYQVVYALREKEESSHLGATV